MPPLPPPMRDTLFLIFFQNADGVPQTASSMLACSSRLSRRAARSTVVRPRLPSGLLFRPGGGTWARGYG